jgi:uncharacterized membrane protein
MLVFRTNHWRSYVAFAFAAIHLSVISFFAFVNHTDAKLASRAGLLRALTESVIFYSNWSGVGTAYSYFAPKVAQIPRTRFEIVHVSGEISEYILGVHQFEIQLRVAALTRVALLPDARVLFARSLAAMAFSQERDAQRVTVIFEDTDFPDFAEALAGQEAIWTTTYSAQFVKEGDEIVCRCQ